MFPKKLANVFVYIKKKQFESKSYEIKRIGCRLLLEMTDNEKILCLDYKLEKMNKQNDF
jgi:hypothetical protein